MASLGQQFRNLSALADPAQTIHQEVTMELLTDIASALRSVARDFLPLRRFDVNLSLRPLNVTLRIPEATNRTVERELHELAAAVKAVTDKSIPSLPLEYRVIGGFRATGIVITVKPDAAPVYGNVVKLRPLWLRPSEYLRRLRPALPERIEL